MFHKKNTNACHDASACEFTAQPYPARPYTMHDSLPDLRTRATYIPTNTIRQPRLRFYIHQLTLPSTVGRPVSSAVASLLSHQLSHLYSVPCTTYIPHCQPLNIKRSTLIAHTTRVRNLYSRVPFQTVGTWIQDAVPSITATQKHLCALQLKTVSIAALHISRLQLAIGYATHLFRLTGQVHT